MFNAIYGSDGRDDTVVDAPFAWNPDVPLSSLKIGYVESEFNATGGGFGGGGRGAANPEDARRRAEERNTLLKDALDVLRARRREARADDAARLPGQRAQLHPRARRRPRRSTI